MKSRFIMLTRFLAVLILLESWAGSIAEEPSLPINTAIQRSKAAFRCANKEPIRPNDSGGESWSDGSARLDVCQPTDAERLLYR